MALTLTIATVDKSALLQASPALRVTDELNARNTCEFTLVDTSGAYRPDVGAAVEVAEGATVVFAGTIDRIQEGQFLGNSTALVFACSCVDYNQVCDRHLVAAVYEAQTLKQIVEDIVANNLAGESITTTNVETGPTITKAVFNYMTVAAVFDELAELTGYAWNIDYTKDLHFFSRETNAAPFSLTDSSNNFRALSVTRTREQYRNKQYIRAGYAETATQTLEKPSPAPDGIAQTFVLRYPVAKVPTVLVNSVAQTVGIRDLESGKKWYWSKQDNTITQDIGETPLAVSDVLEVTYIGLYPIIVSSQVDTGITARIAVEGGSGIYEAIDEDASIDDLNLAVDKAIGLLRKYGTIQAVVEFETDDDGLQAGQLIELTLAAHSLSGLYLIDSVQIEDVETATLRYRVRALSGESLGGWVNFFKALAPGKTFVIRENEVLVLVRSYADGLTCSDTLTASSAAPESRVGTATVGYSEVGA